MVFAIHQHESAIGIHVPPLPNPSLTSLPTPSQQVVTEHRLWVPYIMPQTPTGYLFYIR